MYRRCLTVLISACILAFGNVIKSSGKGQAVELQALEVELLGKCVPAEFPISGKGIPLEKLRSVAHLRARTNTVSNFLRFILFLELVLIPLVWCYG